MHFRSFLKTASLGAGMMILFAGIALAQSAPTPPVTPQTTAPQTSAPKTTAPSIAPAADDTFRRGDRRAMRQECAEKIGKDVARDERREKMRACMREARGAAPGMEGRREGREARREQRGKLHEARKACFDSLKDQRFTVAERRAEVEKCVVAKVPEHAKQVTCRQEAETRKLERRTREFRSFMRQCMTAQ
jgi:hypothetical protein